MAPHFVHSPVHHPSSTCFPRAILWSDPFPLESRYEDGLRRELSGSPTTLEMIATEVHRYFAQPVDNFTGAVDLCGQPIPSPASPKGIESTRAPGTAPFQGADPLLIDAPKRLPPRSIYRAKAHKYRVLQFRVVGRNRAPVAL